MTQTYAQTCPTRGASTCPDVPGANVLLNLDTEPDMPTRTTQTRREGSCRDPHGWAPLYCECGQPADAVHLLDGGIAGRYPIAAGHVRAKPSCSSHDWGGYWLTLEDLLSEPEVWRRQLAEKVWRGDWALVAAGLPPAAEMGRVSDEETREDGPEETGAETSTRGAEMAPETCTPASEPKGPQELSPNEWCARR